MSIPLVAIIGRANVGKSTLFNRLINKRSAIVHNTAGVTRDRIYGQTDWLSRPLRLVDTGGIEFDSAGEIELRVQDQGKLAQDEADAIVFVVDNQEGVTVPDREVIAQIRKSGKPIFLAINKVDHPSHELDLHEFSELGMDAVYAISAEHSIGVYELIQAVAGSLPESDPEEGPDDSIKVAIIGRPNVGKSSLVNKLLRSERSIVTNIPGTTRDAVDSHFICNDQDFVLVDTAGIRRKGKTRALLDKYSVIMSLKAMDRCDIALLVLDATEDVADQDAAIAGYAVERGRAVMILANKWDLIKGQPKAFDEFEENIKQKLKFLDFAPVYAVSALSGRGLANLMPHVQEVHQQYTRVIPTAKLNECFQQALRKNPMSNYKGKFLKFYYATQVKSSPPTFRCFVNYPAGIHFSYKRYLTNFLRQTFGFSGTPVRLFFTARDERSMRREE